MTQEQSTNTAITPSLPSAKLQRPQVGIIIESKNVPEAIEKIKEAEEAGVQQVWMTQSGPADTLTIFTAAAVQAQKIRFGSAIVPTYPRHPLVMAQQALAFSEIAPQRLRLGIGPSHRPVIENMYGLEMTKPLAHLREYMEVLRAALWTGQVDYQGTFFKVKIQLPRTAPMPILISALGEKAFEVAGEISDGAISWLCPVPYLLEKAMPALKKGAERQQRPVPPVIAHVLVALSEDAEAVHGLGRERLRTYTRLPFYAHMFEEAGVPVAADGSGIDRLVDTLIVQGNAATVEQKLRELQTSGLDELLLHLVPVENEPVERAELQRIIVELQ